MWRGGEDASALASVFVSSDRGWNKETRKLENAK